MKVIEEQPEKLVLEITGESHTICNILRKRLMDYDEVDAAAYDITHPFLFFLFGFLKFLTYFLLNF